MNPIVARLLDYRSEALGQAARWRAVLDGPNAHLANAGAGYRRACNAVKYVGIMLTVPEGPPRRGDGGCRGK